MGLCGVVMGQSDTLEIVSVQIHVAAVVVRVVSEPRFAGVREFVRSCCGWSR